VSSAHVFRNFRIGAIAGVIACQSLIAPGAAQNNESSPKVLAARLEKQLAVIEALQAEFDSLQERLGLPPPPPPPPPRPRPEEITPDPGPAPVELPDPVMARPNPVDAPGVPENFDPVPRPTPLPPPSVRETRPYVVKAGETFSSIAVAEGVALNQILAANPDVDPRKLRAGQTIRLPGSGETAVGVPEDEPPIPEAEIPPPAPLPEPAPVVDPAPPPIAAATHLVVPGDTLSRIAPRYGTTVEALMRENNITNPATLQAGMVLRIPGRSAPGPAQPDSAPAAAPPTDPPPPPPAETLYTVLPGDTLFRISQKTGLTVERIRALNPNLDGDRIYPGQVFRLHESVPLEQTSMRPNPSAVNRIPPADESFGLYRVRPGETLSSLARKFFLSRQEIASWNQLEDEAMLAAGQSLRLPQSALDARAALEASGDALD